MFRQVLIILLISKTILARTSHVCAEVPNGYFVRSSLSCNSYNHCMNGQPIYGVCPKGHSFNPSIQMCSHNIDVDCHLCSPYGIQNIPYPDNCSMYYRCVNGVRKTMSCSSGLLFDRYYGDCNIAEKVVCEPKNTICEPFIGLVYLGSTLIGNPLDCTSYYYCINGKAHEAVCPSGLFYNPYTGTCEIRDTIDFCQGIGPLITTPIPEYTTREYLTTESTTRTTVRIIYVTKSPTTTDAETPIVPTTPTTSTSVTTTTSTTTTTPSTEETTTEETTTEETTTEETTTEVVPPTPAPPPVLVCIEGVTGYYPYPSPDNCTRYYYCSRGTLRYTYTCNPGLFFTPGDDRCYAIVPPGCEYLVE